MTIDISYKNYTKKNDIHGTVLYPAVMIAPVQKNILDELIDKTVRTKIFDPFYGSGTSLYEAMEISNDVDLVGCDINPLANLITRVKLQGVSSEIVKSIQTLKSLLSEPVNSIYQFPNIEKWFRSDIIASLTHVRNCIIQIENQSDRLFFWCMICDIVRKYSNTRSSTYKLHVKSMDDIKKIKDNVIHDFIDSVENNYKKYLKRCNSFVLYKGNTLSLIRNFKNMEFDISITSPPYGDNGTTVPYGQFSMLPLYWIDKKDLVLEGWEYANFSLIDSMSLGGPFSKDVCKNQHNHFIEPYLSQITEHKKRKVTRFFNDYFVFLDEMSRVTKKYIVMTLGNRTVDGIKIDLTKITSEYLSDNGFTQIEIMERDIISKRTPKRVSSVNHQPVSSMTKEYVIVMSRN